MGVLPLKGGVSLNEAILQAQQIDKDCKEFGFSQENLDSIARKGFLNGIFEI